MAAGPVYTGREWALAIPPGVTLLTANHRFRHWSQRAALTAELRKTASWLARSQKVPPLHMAHIVLELHVRSQRRRDPLNWADSVKALTDGLVDAGVVPDDDARHVLGPDIRQEGPAGSQVVRFGGADAVTAVLRIRELSRM